jgi:hypothetical protein
MNNASPSWLSLTGSSEEKQGRAKKHTLISVKNVIACLKILYSFK